MFHVGATGCQRDLSPGISKSVGAGAGTYHPTEQPEPSMEIVHHVKLLKGPRSDGASEKTRDLSPSHPGEQQTDVALEGWKGSAESILLFVRVSASYALRSLAGDLTIPPQQSSLFSTTVSLFVIESYKKLSPDAADAAVVLFDQVSHLVGIPAGPSPEPSSPSSPPLGLVPGSFEPSSSVGRAITLWLMSLSLNIACVLWILLQQWWRQSVDPYTQGGEPHAGARVRAGQFSRVGSLAMGRMVEVIWVLLRAS